jgi:hypothetical protein
MKKNGLLHLCGSIRKKESIAAVNYNVLSNSCVAEANLPYSGYYGKLPEHADPNSLFLYTTHFYSLVAVLRFSKKVKSCLGQNVNFAPATLNFRNVEHAAIRVKNFPNYEDIGLLQQCCINSGIQFSKKVNLSEIAYVEVNKCFDLIESDNGIYLDKNEAHKGYIAIPDQINQNDFEKILLNIRNNTDCKLFDAALGAIIINSEIKEIVRIYAENIDLQMLKCIKGKFEKYMLNLKLISV